jgi:glycosidase
MRRLIGLCIVLAALASGISRAQDAPTDWWRDTTWYLLFVRSFYDSDGDGIGDLRGVIEKLDYLNDGDPSTTDDLGITGIWLLPIFEAASYHGYDALDYRSIEQDYGTQADFLDLMDAARARGIRVIVDMVVNHTSSQHPWFQASLAGDPEYADWYVWQDTNPNTQGPWGERAWYEKEGRWYYAPFWSEMPDLNYDNPRVTNEMLDIAGFWLDEMGVDGFRMDAIRYVVEQEVDGRRLLSNTPANREWLARYNAYVKQLNPEAITIGEVWDTSSSVVRYIRDGSVDVAFEFDLAEAFITGGQSRSKRAPARTLERILREYPGGAFATFTSNHDMTRLLTQLQGSVGANRVVASMLLTAPGTPFIYYGEEIGMMGDKPDEFIRTPMQWDSTPITGGFTAGTPWQPLTSGFEAVTVAQQTGDPASLLSHYRSLIHLRNTYSALRTGETFFPATTGGSVYAILRQDAEGTFLVIINLADREIERYDVTLDDVELTLSGTAEVVYSDGTGAVVPPTLSASGTLEAYKPKPSLAPHETLIIRLS